MFFWLSFFVWPWPDPTCVSWQGPSVRTRTEWPFETCPSMALCICPQWALSAPQTLCATTTTPGSDFTLTKDGLKDEILPPPTCSLMRNVLFQPHHSGIVYTSVLRGDGIPYSMANCKMQAPHRFRIPLQRRWRIKATFWTLILWLYWAADWLPVWLPPKASRMSSRMQAHTILLQMSSFKSRPQSHCDCLNIMNSPKRTTNICGSFWTPFQNVQYQRWLKS